MFKISKRWTVVILGNLLAVTAGPGECEMNSVKTVIPEVVQQTGSTQDTIHGDPFNFPHSPCPGPNDPVPFLADPDCPSNARHY